MYSQHAAATRASHLQPTFSTSDPLQVTANTKTMPDINTLQQPTSETHHRGSSHLRLLQQQDAFCTPFGALGETLPSKYDPVLGKSVHQKQGGNTRRSFGDPSMIAYTERAKEVTQRRYQYNFPQSYAPPNQTKGFGTGMGRKWASLPKLNHRKDSTSNELLKEFNLSPKRADNRPQSDITLHEPMSRPNTPVRPASESFGSNVTFSPRIRRRGSFQKRASSRSLPANILTLNEEDESEILFEDELSKEDSGIEAELRALQSSPIFTADATSNGSDCIQIVPFPSLAEFQTAPAVLHMESQPKPKPKPKPRSRKPPEQSMPWARKGQTRTVTVTVTNKITVLRDKEAPKPKPRTLVDKDPPIAPENDTYGPDTLNFKYSDSISKRTLKPVKAARYSKQMSESGFLQPSQPNIVDLAPAPSLDRNEVIVPAVSTPDDSGVSNRRSSETDDTHIKHSETNKLKKIEESKADAFTPGKRLKQSHLPPQTDENEKEASDISITGSKVNSKPLPAREVRPKVNSLATSPAKDTSISKINKTAPKPVTKSVKKAPTATETCTENDKDIETELNDKTEDTVNPDALLASDASVIKGVLKSIGSATDKSKKKSVQFGPKFVREVTKITYPWNIESSSSSSSESDSDADTASDDDSGDDEKDETRRNTKQNTKKVEKKVKVLDDALVQERDTPDEIDIVGSENNSLFMVQANGAEADVKSLDLKDKSMDKLPEVEHGSEMSGNDQLVKTSSEEHLNATGANGQEEHVVAAEKDPVNSRTADHTAASIHAQLNGDQYQ